MRCGSSDVHFRAKYCCHGDDNGSGIREHLRTNLTSVEKGNSDAGHCTLSFDSCRCRRSGSFVDHESSKFSKIQIQLALAPNPVNTYTILRCVGRLQNDSKFNVMVFNNSGQPVYSAEATQQQMLSGLRLDLASLVTGVYFVQVSSSSVLSTLKFLKN